ncbi:hypothetical protein COBT_002123 [Conglomerata obtusa]
MHYDLIIIGAGSGGIASARLASTLSLRTLLIERGVTGGTCVNLGCVPKKISSNLASLISNIHTSKFYGVDSTYELNFKEFAEKRNAYVCRLNGIYEKSIASWDHVDYVRGEGTLVEGGVMVDGKLYTYSKVILATGARPMNLVRNKRNDHLLDQLVNTKNNLPNEDEVNLNDKNNSKGFLVGNDNSKEIIPDTKKDSNFEDNKKKEEIKENNNALNDKSENKTYENNEKDNESKTNETNKNENEFIMGHEFLKTSNDFFYLKEVPKKTVIIGSGYIAVELSFILRALKSEVTVIARGNKILSHFDSIIGENVKEAMIKKGITIHFNSDILKAEETKLFFSKNNEINIIDNINFLMCSIGRDCDLSFIKIPVDKDKNFIKVDDNFMTSIKNVYAIGDLIGSRFMLTPVAIFCGRKLVELLYNEIQEKKLNNEDNLNEKDKNNKSSEHLKNLHYDKELNDETNNLNKINTKKQTLVDKFKIFDYVPSVIFSHPPSATVGLTENEAKMLQGEMKVYQSKFINLFYSLCGPEEKESSVFKVIVLDGKVVGLHMFGMGCDEIVQGFSVAMKMGATFEDFKNVIGVHPTASEEVVTIK